MIRFKDIRKEIKQETFLYIQYNHNLEFTTLKKIGTKYDTCLVSSISTLGEKIHIIIK